MAIIKYVTINEGMVSEPKLNSRNFRLGIRPEEMSEYIHRKKPEEEILAGPCGRVV